jgi:hypothetical protein
MDGGFFTREIDLLHVKFWAGSVDATSDISYFVIGSLRPPFAGVPRIAEGAWPIEALECVDDW